MIIRGRLNGLNLWQRLLFVAAVLWFLWSALLSFVGKPSFIVSQRENARFECGQVHGYDAPVCSEVISDAVMQARWINFMMMILLIPMVLGLLYVTTKTVRWVWAGRNAA